MSAATTQLRWVKHGSGQRVRQGVTRILRSSGWKTGWVIVAHDDRLMPYPASGFNSTVTAAAGGPLQIAGADANGGFRAIARHPGVRISITNGGALSVKVVEQTATRDIQIVAQVGTDKAGTIYDAVRANGKANELIDWIYTGNGTGDVAALLIASGVVPYVRVWGISQGECENTETSDQVIDDRDPRMVCEYGMFKLAAAAALPPGGPAYLLDNNTLQPGYTPLLLPVPLVGYDDDERAICDIGASK